MGIYIILTDNVVRYNFSVYYYEFRRLFSAKNTEESQDQTREEGFRRL